MNVATVLLNSDLNHDTLSLIGMRTKWHWCQARGASKAMIWWRPTRFPWFAGTEEWFLSSGGSWSPKSCHRLVSETIENVYDEQRTYTLMNNNGAKNKITSCSSVLTRAPMTPREVSLRYSNGLEALKMSWMEGPCCLRCCNAHDGRLTSTWHKRSEILS